MLSSRLVFIERDLAPFFIPPKVLWVSMVKAWEMPLWNPHNYSGIPLLATLQPGVFYPPHVFYLFLPFNIVWNWLIILHFVFAGSGICLLLRYFKASHSGSFAGAIVFILSGYLLSVHNLLTHLFAVAWFPLVILFCIRALHSGKNRDIVLTAVFLAMEFLAGAPEIVMLTVPVLVALAFFSGSFFEDGISRRGRAMVIALICVLSLLMVSVQLIPFYELKQYSVRNTGLSYKQAVTWSFAWKDLIQFFLPDVFGYAQTTEKYWANQSWLKTVYLGIIPFALSVFYFLDRDKKRWFFLALIILSFLFAMGGNTPVYKLLYRVPPFNSIRYPVKFLFLFFFAISITSGIGLDRLREGVARGDKRMGTVVQVFFYAGLGFALMWGFLNLFNDNVIGFAERHGLKPDKYNEIWFNLHNLKRFLLFSFLFCGALLFYLRRKQKRFIALCIIGLLTADLFLASFGFYSSLPWKMFTYQGGFLESLLPNRETERYFVTPQTESEYEHALQGRIIMSSPYAAMFGIYSAGGSEVMKIIDYEHFMSAHYCGRTLVDATRFFDISGVRYITTSYDVKDKSFKLLQEKDFGKKKAYLYEYTGYRGRFFVYGQARFVHDDKAAVAVLLDNGVDLRKELVIIDPERKGEKGTGDRGQGLEGERKEEQGTGVRIQMSERQGKGTQGGAGIATLVSYGPNRVVMESQSDSSGFLYISDTYYPGWRAYVDGKETKIYRANLAFRAVEVPKGRHTVVFRYVPIFFYIGLALTLFGIALCVWLWRRDKKGGEGFKA